MAKIQSVNPNDQPTGKWRLMNELGAGLANAGLHLRRGAHRQVGSMHIITYLGYNPFKKLKKSSQKCLGQRTLIRCPFVKGRPFLMVCNWRVGRSAEALFGEPFAMDPLISGTKERLRSVSQWWLKGKWIRRRANRLREIHQKSHPRTWAKPVLAVAV